MRLRDLISAVWDEHVGEDDRFLELALPTLTYCCKGRCSCHLKEALARVQGLSTHRMSF